MGKGLDIQISANGSYRKMNKDGKAWTARLSHVVYRMTPTTLEKPYLNPDWVEWLMGFPRKWTDIPFGPKNPPTSRACRRCAEPQQADENTGNAVSPPQVFPILKYIADIETGRCPWEVKNFERIAGKSQSHPDHDP